MIAYLKQVIFDGNLTPWRLLQGKAWWESKLLTASQTSSLNAVGKTAPRKCTVAIAWRTPNKPIGLLSGDRSQLYTKHLVLGRCHHFSPTAGIFNFSPPIAIAWSFTTLHSNLGSTYIFTTDSLESLVLSLEGQRQGRLYHQFPSTCCGTYCIVGPHFWNSLSREVDVPWCILQIYIYIMYIYIIYNIHKYTCIYMYTQMHVYIEFYVNIYIIYKCKYRCICIYKYYIQYVCVVLKV